MAAIAITGGTRLLALAAARGRATHAAVPMLAAQMELMLRFMGVA